MGQFWLEYDNQGSRQRFDFDKLTVSIGRDPASDFHLDHPTVSRQHALIAENRGAFQLVVLSQTGLTAVNGQPVQGTVDLHAGQLIQLGELQFLFHSNATRTGLAEPPTEQFDLAKLGGDNTAPIPVGGGEPATAALPAVGANPFQSGFHSGNIPPQNAGQGGFGAQAGFGAQPGFGSPAGFQSPGFGQTPAGFQSQGAGVGEQAQSQPKSAFGSLPPAPGGGAPAPAAKARDDETGGIPSWDTIAARAIDDDDDPNGPTNFQRLQEAQKKAAAKSQGTNPMVLVLGGLGIVGMMYFLFFHEPAKPPVAVADDAVGCTRNICPPQPYTCNGAADCQDKALNAYKVADELYQKRGANITNLYEAYKQLDKAEIYLEVGGISPPPESMKDYQQRMERYEKELDKIASEHRIRYHQLLQRKMYDDMAETLDGWMAHFPDRYTTWWQEAVAKEREMKDKGTYPKKRMKKKD